MLISLLQRLGLLGLVGLLAGCAATAMTAQSTVPASHAGTITQAITPNDLKPSVCAGITVTNLVTGSGTVAGTSANDLILGSAGNDTLGAKDTTQGSDCCVGGGGTNTYRNGCTAHT
jgi:hypothetical protein